MTPYIHTSTGLAHVSVGGPTYLIDCGDKIVAFEAHPQFGPTPVNKRTGDVLITDPTKYFWDAYYRWRYGGEKIDSDGVTCIVPQWCRQCKGNATVIGLDNVVGVCALCTGKKVEDNA